tara:strand:+ start:787 stop:1350 length:564 start_codon:yes stop_codon:yes gene_type:complete
MLKRLFSIKKVSKKLISINEDTIFKLVSLKIYNNDFKVLLRKNPITELGKYFSLEDNKKQFIPEGIPFKGEFDNYFDIIKDDKFYGFYRISLLPEKVLEIHCGFVHFDSLLARRYIRITELVLKEIQLLFNDHLITSECSFDHQKANNYLKHFCFRLSKSNSEVNTYILDSDNFKSKFAPLNEYPEE